MMAENHRPIAADEASAANETMLNGFWCRAVESLVGQGVLWTEAAKSMLSVAALQVEHAMGVEAAERSLDGAARYMRTKREASEQLDKIALNKSRH